MTKTSDPETRVSLPDLYRWSGEQASYLRAGRLDRLDLMNLADEIDDVGHSEYDALVSALAIVLQHMLKWDHQPERMSRSWANSVAEHRSRVERSLKRSPSLRARLGDVLSEAYGYGRLRASSETNLSLTSFPETCPYEWHEITTRAFAYEV